MCAQRQEVTARQSIIAAFLARFTLTSEEVEAITSREIPVGKRFFTAMDKAERIRNDCRVLMAGEDGPTKLGCVLYLPSTTSRKFLNCLIFHSVDIVTATSGYLEQAYEKIFRWCSFEFRQMGRDASIEVHSYMREAVRRLRKRPELLT
jgi:conserved oligomeric Golgi complex subunit 6